MLADTDQGGLDSGGLGAGGPTVFPVHDEKSDDEHERDQDKNRRELHAVLPFVKRLRTSLCGESQTVPRLSRKCQVTHPWS